MGFMGFGRKPFGQAAGGFGRKGLGTAQPQAEPQPGRRIFGERGGSGDGSSPFERFFANIERERDRNKTTGYQIYASSEAMTQMSPEERGELLADLADKPGRLDGFRNENSPREKTAYSANNSIWNHEIEVRKEHLPTLLSMLLGDERFRKETYYETRFAKLMQLIDSAIKQGAYLSSGDLEALAAMAADTRNQRARWKKADTKQMIARAEKLEKLAGVEVSATEFLMARCEGAENPWAIADKPRPNAQFWADLLAEVATGLEEIRVATKGSSEPAWMRDEAAFASAWPAVGEVQPQFRGWTQGQGTPFSALSQHNGKRTGFAEPEAYRDLPRCIALAQPHTRYDWKSTQIPGLEVLADLENPDWTALVEQLITQRRATRATKSWEKDMLGLCEPLGLATVEARLHDWLALFHTPAMDKAVYTHMTNGERFAAAVERLEETHPEWPHRHAQELPALGRAIAMMVASSGTHGLCPVFNSQLNRLDDRIYKSTRVTEGVLSLPKPSYKHCDGRNSYESLPTMLRASVENEEFLRGAVWLIALMPDRARAIDALEKVAQTAATYTWTGEEGMRSKIVANAAIATLIAMGGSDVDAAVLRLTKVIENRTITPPLLKYLNLAA